MKSAIQILLLGVSIFFFSSCENTTPPKPLLNDQTDLATFIAETKKMPSYPAALRSSSVNPPLEEICGKLYGKKGEQRCFISTYERIIVVFRPKDDKDSPFSYWYEVYREGKLTVRSGDPVQPALCQVQSTCGVWYGFADDWTNEELDEIDPEKVGYERFSLVFADEKRCGEIESACFCGDKSPK